MNKGIWTFVSFVSLLFVPRGAAAQPPEAIGIRAQGMAGAFTAVADDAAATWWNPAGLAAGAYFNVILEWASQDDPRRDNALPAAETASRGFAIAYPAFGLSYYRLRVSEIQPLTSTAAGAPGRQDLGSGDVRLRSLNLQHFGATVGQSIGQHLVLASTLKLLRGSLALDVQPGSVASLDAASELEADSDTHAGLDFGAMAKIGGARFAVMVRDLNEPEFESGGVTFTLDRQVRVGIAYASHLAAVALDVDVTSRMTAMGEERRLAAGAEAWSTSRRVGLRGGVGLNTIGDAHPSASGGASVALRPGTFVDVAGTLGSDDARRGWGVAMRVTF